MTMSGGRSPSEAKGAAGGRKMTEKTMFRELRQKLNTAAEDPAFFDTAAGKVVRTLFLSGGLVFHTLTFGSVLLMLGFSTCHYPTQLLLRLSTMITVGFSLSRFHSNVLFLFFILCIFSSNEH